MLRYILPTWLLLSAAVTAVDRTYTDYWAVGTGTDDYDEVTYLGPDITPAASAHLSTFITTLGSDDNGYELVEIYVDGDAVALVTSTSTSQILATSTQYWEPWEFDAPASCGMAYPSTMYRTVYLSAAWQESLVASTILRTITPSPAVATRTHEPTVVADAFLSERVRTEEWLYQIMSRRYPEQCRDFNGKTYNDPNHSADADADTDVDTTTRCNGECRRLLIYILVPGVGGVFLLLIWDSYHWFSRIMQGRSAQRPSALCLIGGRPRRIPPRPPADQARLMAQWNSTGARRRLKLWLTWGFRESYPVRVLGPHPALELEDTTGTDPWAQATPQMAAAAPATPVTRPPATVPTAPRVPEEVPEAPPPYRSVPTRPPSYLG